MRTNHIILSILLAASAILAGCQKDEPAVEETPYLEVALNSSSVVFGNDNDPKTVTFEVIKNTESTLTAVFTRHNTEIAPECVDCSMTLSADGKTGTITFTPTEDKPFTESLDISFSNGKTKRSGFTVAVGRTTFKWADGTIATSFNLRDDHELELPLESPLQNDVTFNCNADWITYSMKDEQTVLLKFELNNDRNNTVREATFSMVDEAVGVTLSCDFVQKRSARSILTEFYEIADGPNWRCQTNWLSDEPIYAWEGINGSQWKDGKYWICYNGNPTNENKI